MDRTERRWFNKYKNILMLNEKGVLTLMPAPNTGTPARIVLPQRHIDEVIAEAHTNLGHQGEKKVHARITALFDWPRLRLDIQMFIARCTECQRARPMIKRARHRLKPIKSSYKNELVQID
jgi:hypothetical protein